MSELTVFNEIADLLSRFVTRVGIVAKLNRQDINVSAENVVCQLFRVVYALKELRNLNAEGNANFPGLDLADDSARIALQITSSTTSTKVKETLEQIRENRYYERYDRFIIYVLTQRKTISEGKDWNALPEGEFAFRVRDDIWDNAEIN